MTEARLVSCAACARHVRADEAACPFCGATVTKARTARAATTLAAAAAVALVQGCYGGPPPGVRDVREPVAPRAIEDAAPPTSGSRAEPDAHAPR